MLWCVMWQNMKTKRETVFEKEEAKHFGHRKAPKITQNEDDFSLFLPFLEQFRYVMLNHRSCAPFMMYSTSCGTV